MKALSRYMVDNITIRYQGICICGLVNPASTSDMGSPMWQAFTTPNPTDKQKLPYNLHTLFLPMPHIRGPQSSSITDLFSIQMAGVLQTDLKCWLCLGHAYSVSLESHYSLISCGNEISASHCVQITWPLTPRTKSAFFFFFARQEWTAGMQKASRVLPGSGPSRHMEAPAHTSI